MVTLKAVELIIGVLTFFLAYLLVITVASVFRARIADKMGDPTPCELGFDTWNPLFHVDVMGLIFLVLFYFGWPRYVPINPFNITEPRRGLKLAFAFLSDTIAYFSMALVGIIGLIITFGPRMLYVAQSMLICFSNMTHLYLIETCPTLSSLQITLSFLAISVIYLSIVLGVLYLVINGCSVLFFVLIERSPGLAQYHQYLVIAIPVLVIFFFSEYLRILAIALISYIGYGISHLLHLV